MDLRKAKDLMNANAYKQFKKFEDIITAHGLCIFAEYISSISDGGLLFHIIDNEKKFNFEFYSENMTDFPEGLDTSGITCKEENEKNFIATIKKIETAVKAVV